MKGLRLSDCESDSDLGVCSLLSFFRIKNIPAENTHCDPHIKKYETPAQGFWSPDGKNTHITDEHVNTHNDYDVGKQFFRWING